MLVRRRAEHAERRPLHGCRLVPGDFAEKGQDIGDAEGFLQAARLSRLVVAARGFHEFAGHEDYYRFAVAGCGED